MIIYLLLYHSFHCFFFFFNDTATTEIYTLSLHDALPISSRTRSSCRRVTRRAAHRIGYCSSGARRCPDRKSTRLNSSHSQISYAVFCLKKKKKKTMHYYTIAMNLAYKASCEHVTVVTLCR